MKKFELDLSEFEVEVLTNKEGELVTTEVYPMRENISNFLRMAGVFDTGEEIVEAITVAKAILKEDSDIAALDDKEVAVLKKGMNRHIEATKEGGSQLGGPIHEELILRIFGMKEVK